MFRPYLIPRLNFALDAFEVCHALIIIIVSKPFDVCRNSELDIRSDFRDKQGVMSTCIEDD